MELLNIPGFVDECKEGIEEIKAGGGKDLSELDCEGIVKGRKIFP
jgi:hypothetical protein